MTKLDDIIKPAVVALDFDYVGCEVLAQGRGQLLRVYVDHEKGVSVDACAQLSRQIGAVLDVENPFSGQYTLEVSSPGLERRLFILEHYVPYVGQSIKVRLSMPLDGRRNFKGELIQVDQQLEQVKLKVDEQFVDINFSDIDKANLIYEF